VSPEDADAEIEKRGPQAVPPGRTLRSMLSRVLPDEDIMDHIKELLAEVRASLQAPPPPPPVTSNSEPVAPEEALPVR
jgi:hypothetical protein